MSGVEWSGASERGTERAREGRSERDREGAGGTEELQLKLKFENSDSSFIRNVHKYCKMTCITSTPPPRVYLSSIM